MNTEQPLKLAIVGCGAMSELGHLPALCATDLLVPTILIDTNEARARTLSEKFSIPNYSTRLEDAPLYADAACVVVPHFMHAEVACALISHGLHVLIEKPLAITLTQCDAIISSAQDKGVVLAVAMVRRFARTTRFIKEALQQGALGKATSFRLVSGAGDVWPTRSPYLLNSEQSGGGVLMSNGVHDLDLLSYLFGQPEEFAFFADADFGKTGRLESDVMIRMTTASGARGTLDLSRTRNLHNGLWIELERAKIYSPLYGDNLVVNLNEGGSLSLSGKLRETVGPVQSNQTFNDMLTAQLDDFALAVRRGGGAMVDGLEGRKAVETIERCYANTRPLEFPWRQPVIVPEGA